MRTEAAPGARVHPDQGCSPPGAALSLRGPRHLAPAGPSAGQGSPPAPTPLPGRRPAPRVCPGHIPPEAGLARPQIETEKLM